VTTHIDARESDQPLAVSRMGGLKVERDWRTRTVKCPVNDPLCIANHLESDYCFHESTGAPVPEATEGVGVAVISPGTSETSETLETPEEPVEGESVKITLRPEKAQNFLLPKEYALEVGTDLHKDGAAITGTAVADVTEGGYADYVHHTHAYLTPEVYAKRWTKNWINFDLDLTPVAARTGRRVDRRDKLVKRFDKPVRYPFARGCGHQFVELQQPRHRNCETCWNAFFWNQNEMTENIARNVQEQGPEIVQAIHGKKFLTHFLRFAILLARYEQFKQTAGTECAAQAAEGA
jgi:hypothetical protein